MLYNELETHFNNYSHNLDPHSFETYELSFFKCYTKFQRYISELFVSYALGQTSEEGYLPSRIVCFNDFDRLHNFLKMKGERYVDYFQLALNSSQYFFEDGTNPFAFLRETADYSQTLSQMEALRNHIAHESDDSKRNYIKKTLFEHDYIEPGHFLMDDKSGFSPKISNYSYFISVLKDIAKLCLNYIR